jgi:hypothetical protein
MLLEALSNIHIDHAGSCMILSWYLHALHFGMTVAYASLRGKTPRQAGTKCDCAELTRPSCCLREFSLRLLIDPIEV